MPKYALFSNYAVKYYERDYPVVPCIGKAPCVSKWQRFSNSMPKQETFDSWIEKFPTANIALVLGKISEMLAIDIDVEEEELLNKIKGILPDSPLKKRGKKGITYLYKNVSKETDNRIPNRLKIGQGLGDILIQNCVTVIPPSVHPDNNKSYKWIDISDVSMLDLDREELLSYLPSLDYEEILKIKLNIEVLKEIETPSRGPLSFKVGCRNDSYKKMVTKAYTKGKSIEKVTDEVLKHNKTIEVPLFKNKEEVENFVTSCFKSAKNHKIEIKEEDSELDSNIDRIKEFSNKFILEYFSVPFKDKFDPQAYILKKDSNTLFLPHDKDLRSIFSSYLILDKKRISDFYNTLEEIKFTEFINLMKENFNLFRFQTPIEKLDFKIEGLWKEGDLDRIGLLCSKYLKPINYTKEEVSELFKVWMSKIVKKAFPEKYKDNNLQNPMLILQSEKQGIGKDEFIRRITAGLGKYSAEFSGGKDNDNYILASKHLVLHVDEADKLIGKYDDSMVKSFIFSKSKIFRPPYGKVPLEYKQHASYIGSTNVDDLLKDPTGGRRFILIKLKSIDQGFFKDKELTDSKMLWEQAAALAESDYKYSVELENKIKSIESNFTPVDPKKEILNLYFELMPSIIRDMNNRSGEFSSTGKYSHINFDDRVYFGIKEEMVSSYIIEEFFYRSFNSKKFGIGSKNFLSLLKNKDLYKEKYKGTNVTRYYIRPLEEVEYKRQCEKEEVETNNSIIKIDERKEIMKQEMLKEVENMYEEYQREMPKHCRMEYNRTDNAIRKDYLSKMLITPSDVYHLMFDEKKRKISLEYFLSYLNKKGYKVTDPYTRDVRYLASRIEVEKSKPEDKSKITDVPKEVTDSDNFDKSLNEFTYKNLDNLPNAAERDFNSAGDLKED